MLLLPPLARTLLEALLSLPPRETPPTAAAEAEAAAASGTSGRVRATFRRLWAESVERGRTGPEERERVRERGEGGEEGDTRPASARKRKILHDTLNTLSANGHGRESSGTG